MLPGPCLSRPPARAILARARRVLLTLLGAFLPARRCLLACVHAARFRLLPSERPIPRSELPATPRRSVASQVGTCSHAKHGAADQVPDAGGHTHRVQFNLQ